MTFPTDFVFGAATAAFQIEGATAEDGRGASIWDRFCRTPGKVLHGDTANIACDHYHRLEADLDLVRELGLDAYRFSIAWPRVLPDGRTVNPRGLDFYERVVDGLLARGITPMATLYHWDLPQVLEDAGGWPARDTASAFASYADVVGRRLADRVAHWVTVNEPWCSAFVGYLEGRHAPGIRDLSASLAAAHHLLLGHGLAVPALRAAGARSIGAVVNLSDVHAASDRPANVAAAARVDGHENRWFLEPLRNAHYPDDMLAWYGQRADLAPLRSGDLATIAVPTDFLGINFYERHVVAHDSSEPIHEARKLPVPPPLTAGGCAIRPDAFRDVLVRVHRDYGAPVIYVTENGAGFADYVDPEGGVDDLERVEYFRGYLGAVEEAIAAGADVRGYFAWSLLDNFEWALGYSLRFGLVFVDFGTQRRIPKASARFYSQIARSRGQHLALTAAT
ncbi:MAG: beta-glucosidase [Chloroflexi bacterium]|nr:beta-glucosidase [Chloroflexota bacterium]